MPRKTYLPAEVHRTSARIEVGGVSCSAVTITSRKAGSQSAAFHSAG